MTHLPIIRCRRCHRVLTDEESRKRGIGDVCLSKETSTQLELFEAQGQKEGVLPMEVFKVDSMPPNMVALVQDGKAVGIIKTVDEWAKSHRDGPKPFARIPFLDEFEGDRPEQISAVVERSRDVVMPGAKRVSRYSEELDEAIYLANTVTARGQLGFTGVFVSTPRRDETLMDLVYQGSPTDVLSEPEQDAFVEHLISQRVAELKRHTLEPSIIFNPRSISP